MIDVDSPIFDEEVLFGGDGDEEFHMAAAEPPARRDKRPTDISEVDWAKLNKKQRKEILRNRSNEASETKSLHDHYRVSAVGHRGPPQELPRS